MEKASIILQQLGGSRFIAMTGAKNILAQDDGLSFKLPSSFAKDGINYVRIRLNGMDLYDIEYGKIQKMKYKPLYETNGIYADMLQDDFTGTTGLFTRL